MSADTANAPVSTVPADDLNKDNQPATASDATNGAVKPEASAADNATSKTSPIDGPKPDKVAKPKKPTLVADKAVADAGGVENLKSFDPFADVGDDDDTNQGKALEYIHIRIQQRNGRKTLTTIQGLPKKFDQKKILKVIKKKFACNGTIVTDTEMGEVIQLQGDQRKDMQDFLKDKKEGLALDEKLIKVHGF